MITEEKIEYMAFNYLDYDVLHVIKYKKFMNYKEYNN